MRASRLVTALLLLQTRGRMTAAELARELEVSERTVHRDVDELSAAGIPIYAERGPHGGVQLVEGYRTRLTGMTGKEAEALFLSGLPGPAAQLGLGTVMTAARLKVLAALPAEMRGRASRLVERFYLDPAGWFQPTDDVPHLATVADAVWGCRRITITYDRGDSQVERHVDPMGLVLKGGTWYLVGSVEEGMRTYRVSRIRGAELTEERFERTPGFDLAGYWTESSAAYEREVARQEVSVRVAPERIGLLAGIRRPGRGRPRGAPARTGPRWLGAAASANRVAERGGRPPGRDGAQPGGDRPARGPRAGRVVGPWGAGAQPGQASLLAVRPAGSRIPRRPTVARLRVGPRWMPSATEEAADADARVELAFSFVDDAAQQVLGKHGISWGFREWVLGGFYRLGR